MDLVENDQAILVFVEEKPRVGEFRPVGGRFEVQIQSSRVLHNVASESRLADLARSDQGHCRLAPQGGGDGFMRLTRNHPC